MSYGAIIEDDNENRESIVVITTEEGNDEGAVVPLTSSDALLAASPKIKYLYEKMDGSKIAKTGYSGLISLGMALYSYRKEKAEGDISTAISSAVVSLACNILVSYEFCLKSPFLAASVLSEIRKTSSSKRCSRFFVILPCPIPSVIESPSAFSSPDL